MEKISLSPDHQEIITFGAGCFWCTEGIFSSITGVQSTIIGYGGGHYPNPSYRSVTDNPDGHAEVTKITFDSSVVSLQDLLSVFFAVHNPYKTFVINHKKGELYRSVILYHDLAQKSTIEEFIQHIKPKFELPLLTEVRPFNNFEAADIKYQEYYKSNPEKPFCRNIIKPKIEKLKSNVNVAHLVLNHVRMTNIP